MSWMSCHETLAAGLRGFMANLGIISGGAGMQGRDSRC